MSKRLEKAKKELGLEAVADLESKSNQDLRDLVVLSEQNIKAVREELEANPKYQELKESLKALREGYKEANKRQKAIIEVSLSLMEGE